MDHVVIVGAGPAGLATAASLSARGVPYRLVDKKGSPGGAYREIRGAITLASPRDLDALPGLPLDEGARYLTAGEYRAYLDRYAAHHRILVEPGEVRRIERTADGFLVDGNAARFVVIATGMWDFPIVPEVPGLVGAIHVRDFRGPDAHPGRLLVVGGAHSAIETAEEIARAGRPVIVAARKLRIARQALLGIDLHYWVGPAEHLPAWLTRRFCERHPTLPGTDLGFTRFVREGLIDLRPALASAAGRVATFVDGSRAEFDQAILATGYRFATPLLPPEVARARAGHLRAHRNESVSWPGLFVVGSPCASRLSSEFLRGIAADAPEVAARIAAAR